MLTARLSAVAVALALASAALGAQPSVTIPVSLNIGVPQGAFAENVSIAGGVGGGVIWKVSGPLALRADLGVMIYGSERRRVPLGGGALGLINVDVTTTNSIFGGSIGGQLGAPGPTVMPYVGGMIGFSAFTTTSSVEGSNSTNQPFASSTNSSDFTFAKSAIAGLYIPVGETGNVHLDLGVRHTWNGERVRYLTRGDITEDINGDIILSPRESRADILTIVLGVSIAPKGRRKP